jgi:hypothetical protein
VGPFAAQAMPWKYAGFDGSDHLPGDCNWETKQF